MLQHKRITELHASLALPLVANASLAFLKRHLALAAPQQALIDESVAANLARLEIFESALARTEAEVCQLRISLTLSQGPCVSDVIPAVCLALTCLVESSVMESGCTRDAELLHFHL